MGTSAVVICKKHSKEANALIDWRLAEANATFVDFNPNWAPSNVVRSVGIYRNREDHEAGRTNEVVVRDPDLVIFVGCPNEYAWEIQAARAVGIDVEVVLV